MVNVRQTSVSALGPVASFGAGQCARPDGGGRECCQDSGEEAGRREQVALRTLSQLTIKMPNIARPIERQSAERDGDCCRPVPIFAKSPMIMS